MVVNFKHLPLNFPDSRQRFDVGLYQNEVKKFMSILEVYVKFQHTIIRSSKKKKKNTPK